MRRALKLTATVLLNLGLALVIGAMASAIVASVGTVLQ